MSFEKCVSFGVEIVPFAVAGAVAGQAAEIVAIEAYAHQELAHRTVRLHPLIAEASRATLVFAGMSPNVFAAEHRRHHTVNDAEPIYSFGERLAHVLRSGGTIAGDVVLDPELLQFPGYSFHDDPLLKQDAQGALSFRKHSAFERYIAKGLPLNVLPIVGAAAATAASLKKAGHKHPVAKSFALFAGFQVGLTSQALLTAYAEAQAGRRGNVMDIQSLPRILRSRTVRHQQHHERPEQPYSGSSRCHIVACKVLQKLRLVSVG